MKKLSLVFLALFVIFSSFLLAQERIDVIYLKNGDIYKGQILKDVPGNYIQLEIMDGTIKKILYSDIEKRETVKGELNTVIKKTKRKDQFGIKGGLSYSTFVGESIASAQHKSGLIIGAFLNSSLSENLALQMELNYAQIGAKTSDYEAEYIFNQNELEIPLLLMIETKNKKTKLSFYPGLGLAFALSSTATIKSSGQEVSGDASEGTEGLFVFACGGLLLNAQISDKSSLIFDIRANLGLTNSMKNVKDGRDFSFNFTIGLGF
jgi:hypothetical protein